MRKRVPRLRSPSSEVRSPTSPLAHFSALQTVADLLGREDGNHNILWFVESTAQPWRVYTYRSLANWAPVGKAKNWASGEVGVRYQ